MGAGGSTEVRPSPAYGVGINPRLEYANRKSELQGGDNILIDAPSLVKLQHGTVRYRYLGEGSETKLDTEHRTEKPHEGDNRHKKHGYFYHSKLNDFSDCADPTKEEAWKFCYVYKGATRAKQKQLYYVFGKGLKTNDKGFIEPNYTSKENEDKDQTEEEKTTQFYKYHGHMYYDVGYIPFDQEIPDKTEEVEILGDGQVKTDINNVRVVVNDTDTIQRIKRKLAVKLFKPATHFHLFQFGEELNRDETASVFKPRAEQIHRFRILLQPLNSVQHNE